jgi:hypothetical protein
MARLMVAFVRFRQSKSLSERPAGGRDWGASELEERALREHGATPGCRHEARSLLLIGASAALPVFDFDKRAIITVTATMSRNELFVVADTQQNRRTKSTDRKTSVRFHDCRRSSGDA